MSTPTFRWTLSVGMMALMAVLLLMLPAEDRVKDGVEVASTPSPPMDIAELLRDPTRYDHKVVTVRGCFVTGFERSTLQPCLDGRHEHMIWFDDYEYIIWSRSLDQGGIPNPTLRMLRPRWAHEEIPFPRDEAREAWGRLPVEANLPIPILVRGEFETIGDQEAIPMQRGYGHLSAYRHRLIVASVLPPVSAYSPLE